MPCHTRHTALSFVFTLSNRIEIEFDESYTFSEFMLVSNDHSFSLQVFQYFQIACLVIGLEILPENDTIMSQLANISTSLHKSNVAETGLVTTALDSWKGHSTVWCMMCSRSKSEIHVWKINAKTSINWLPNNQRDSGVRLRNVLQSVLWILKGAQLVYNWGFADTLI